eukprot:3609329-Rhodomonas_salina.1
MLTPVTSTYASPPGSSSSKIMVRPTSIPDIVQQKSRTIGGVILHSGAERDWSSTKEVRAHL